jgi:KUP system potassium uptake protein
MALWFLIIGILGIWGIAQHPSVLVAINPYYGLHYLFTNGMSGFLVLGGVFLCVTGAEALYADMGHFGARPIRLAWSGLVFPSLILNYAGQAALVLEGAPTSDNIFYRLCPQEFLVPLVLLATIATIIASQSIITGAFSMTRQAIQLGWLPRLQITQTSEEGYGQIYVSVVNWLLMIVTVGLTIGFGKSDNLASAYGIAVSATMLATSALLFIAMREIWKWSLLKAGTIAGIFMIVDAAFFSANLSKIVDGGYVPITFAALVYGIMFTWHKGAEAVSNRINEAVVPIDAFMAQIVEQHIPRTPGAAVFLTRTEQDTPPVMIWHVNHNHVLHQQLFILKVNTRSTPWVKDTERLAVKEIAPNIWRAMAYYGFMEQPDIPELLMRAHNTHSCDMDLQNVTYYVGHETIIPSDDKKALPKWIEAMFAFMQRNSLHVSSYLRLPPDAVVEIGRQVAI